MITDEEYKKEKRGIKVPAFFKRKIFMVCMLLICSGIMAATATYAWFILSTAPEVTGISTTVGANGSLEIALLNNETGENTSLIEADVGDSIAIVGAAEGNVTWGNLVDLSDASYGLNTIVLYPALANIVDEKLDIEAMLSIPHNGYDGRITKVSSNTVASLYNGSMFTTDNAKYGVRAIGAIGTGTSRETYITAAQSSFAASQQSAISAAKNAINANGSVLFSGIGGGDVTYNQVVSMQNMATSLKNALNYILTSYKQAIIATAAANENLSDSDFESIRTGITAATGNSLSSYVSNLPVGTTAAEINALSQQISNAEFAINLANELLYKNYGTEDEEPMPNTTTYTSSQVSGIVDKIIDMDTVSLGSLTTTGVTLSDETGSGLLTAVADYVGNYTAEVSGVTTITINVTTSQNAGKGYLSAISLDGLKAPESATTQATNNSTVTTFYGYVVDLAFRTNVSSNLQLQSAAIDRIYTDGAGATAGSGSGVTYTYAEGMTESQIKSMMAAIRVILFDPESGEIYGKAKLGDVTIESTVAKASLYMMNEENGLQEDGASICTLEVAVPKKVSALVYLNGTSINNMSVINGENSGSVLLNLQFSSSAELKPMDDSDLRHSTSKEYGK